MSLIETMKSLLRQREDDVSQSRAALWNEYQEILGRDDRPWSGDAERLLELAEALGIREPALIEAHAEALRQAGARRPKAEAVADVEARIAELRAKQAAAHAAVLEAQQAARRVAEETRTVETELTGLQSAARELRHLELHFPGVLLGTDDPGEIPGDLAGTLPPAGILHFMRERGLEPKPLPIDRGRPMTAAEQLARQADEDRTWQRNQKEREKRDAIEQEKRVAAAVPPEEQRAKLNREAAEARKRYEADAAEEVGVT